jgi:hypothetical protein
VLNVPTPTEEQDAANKSYVDLTTVIKTSDVMCGNLLMCVGNNPSLSLWCNDLRGNKRFNLLLGCTSDMILNQLGQSVTLRSTDGILCRIGETDIAKFSTSNINISSIFIYG